jgi:hypothetical protein
MKFHFAVAIGKIFEAMPQNSAAEPRRNTTRTGELDHIKTSRHKDGFARVICK